LGNPRTKATDSTLYRSFLVHLRNLFSYRRFLPGVRDTGDIAARTCRFFRETWKTPPKMPLPPAVPLDVFSAFGFRNPSKT
jgi:hypothetical protein